MSSPILQFENFTFKYNAQAEPTLYGIDLSVNKGEKVLIAGASGCGKSTLAHCINGLVPFSCQGESTGDVKLDGKSTKAMSIFEISKYVGTVLQDTDGQFIGLTVAEDIAFALENQCVEDPELHERVLEISKTVSIDRHLHHSPSELSGGQKQRVSLAGVMVDEVDILLFDEPLANLDPETGKKAMELIDLIHQKTGVTVIIIEHRLEDVLWRKMDRIVLLDKGRIVADKSPDEMLSTGLLVEKGIREPLYITALKYAGVKISPDKKPESIGSLNLIEEDKEQVRYWFKETALPEEDGRGQVLLQAEGLNFTYKNERKSVPGFQALRDISLEIKEGELLAIVGKNGAGKSTFSKVVCGFEIHDGGRLTLRGQDLLELSIKERAEHIGYIMQNPNQMISHPMIFDEVAFGLRNRGTEEEVIEQKVEETLKICGLWPFRKWPVSALSYGQKKRVTIASILAMEPELMILDEPTAGQDFRHYTEIMEFLKTLNRQGITIVIITHDMHLMLEYAQRAVVFSDSRLIAEGTPADILTDSEIIEKASLKETSLYELAMKCGIPDGRDFVQHFIDFERRSVRGDD